MSQTERKSQTVELSVPGHQVRLSFTPEQNSTVAQQTRASRIDSYIRQHGLAEEKKA